MGPIYFDIKTGKTEPAVEVIEPGPTSSSLPKQRLKGKGTEFSEKPSSFERLIVEPWQEYRSSAVIAARC